jgi:hypothetical protein
MISMLILRFELSQAGAPYFSLGALAVKFNGGDFQ